MNRLATLFLAAVVLAAAPVLAGARLVTSNMALYDVDGSTQAIVLNMSDLTSDTSYESYADLVSICVQATTDDPGSAANWHFDVGVVTDVNGSTDASIDYLRVGTFTSDSAYTDFFDRCLEPSAAMSKIAGSGVFGKNIVPALLYGKIDTTDDDVNVDEGLTPFVTNVREVSDTDYASSNTYRTVQPTSSNDGAVGTVSSIATDNVEVGDFIFKITEDGGSTTCSINICAQFVVHEKGYTALTPGTNPLW